MTGLIEKLVVNDAIVYADLDSEAVLLDIESGMYFGLDSVGTVIWKLLEKGASEHQIIARLLEEYDVELDQVRADVASFLVMLREKGLVRAIDA